MVPHTKTLGEVATLRDACLPKEKKARLVDAAVASPCTIAPASANARIGICTGKIVKRSLGQFHLLVLPQAVLMAAVHAFGDPRVLNRHALFQAKIFQLVAATVRFPVMVMLTVLERVLPQVLAHNSKLMDEDCRSGVLAHNSKLIDEDCRSGVPTNSLLEQCLLVVLKANLYKCKFRACVDLSLGFLQASHGRC